LISILLLSDPCIKVVAPIGDTAGIPSDWLGDAFYMGQRRALFEIGDTAGILQNGIPNFGDTGMPPDWLGNAFYAKVGIPGCRQIGSETRFMRVVPKGEMPRNGCYGTP
jgi:hypothetical protein